MQRYVKNFTQKKKRVSIKIDARTIERAYDQKNREVIFNGVTTINLNNKISYVLNPLNIKNRTNVNDQNTNSEFTDIRAIYDAILEKLNLDDDIQMTITYSDEGSFYCYEGGKVNKRNFTEEKISGSNFSLHDIRFKNLNLNREETSSFINDIINYQSIYKYKKLISKKKFEELYKKFIKSQCAELFPITLYSDHYAFIDVKVPFINNNTTIGDIKQALRKNFKLSDDIEIKIIRAGYLQKDLTIIERTGDFSGYVFCLNQIFLNKGYPEKIFEYIEKNSSTLITSEILKIIFDQKTSPVKTLKTQCDDLDFELQLKSFLSKNNIVLNGQCNLVDIISENFEIFIFVLHNFENQKRFIEWYNSKKILNNELNIQQIIYHYTGNINDLIDLKILSQDVGLCLQKMKTKYPILPLNPIPYILNEYIYFASDLQTDYLSLKNYLGKYFYNEINYHYYDWYCYQANIKAEYVPEENYISLYNECLKNLYFVDYTQQNNNNLNIQATNNITDNNLNPEDRNTSNKTKIKLDSSGINFSINLKGVLNFQSLIQHKYLLLNLGLFALTTYSAITSNSPLFLLRKPLSLFKKLVNILIQKLKTEIKLL